MTSASTELAAFRGGHDLDAHPRGERFAGCEGGLLHQGQFLVAQVHAADVAAGAGALGSAGREGHDSESSGTTRNKSRSGLDISVGMSRFGSSKTTHQMELA